MKKFLKAAMAILVSVIMTFTSSLQISAYVWYSDSDQVRYHVEAPDIRLNYIHITSDFTREVVENWISTAAKNWRTSNTYPISNTFTSGKGTGNITFIAGKPQILSKNYGIDFVGANGNVVNGRTKTDSVLDETITINGVSKQVRSTKSATVYIMNRLSSGTYTSSETGAEINYSSRSVTGHQNTVSHEMGHALGYNGHSLNSNDLMASPTSNSNLMSITERDRRHIGQFWNVYSLIEEHELEKETVSYFEWREAEIQKNDAINFIENTTAYVDNIIVGTPVEIIQGSLETLDPSEEDCEYLLTEYTFKVSDYLFGNDGETFITVRSQIGNVFELGKEYTFSSRRINNTLFDIYTVNSYKWILDNRHFTPDEQASIVAKISANQAANTFSAAKKKVINTTEPTQSFMNNNVDLAFIATITDISEDTVNDVLDIDIANVNVVKGSVDDGVLTEGLRIRGNIVVGGTYLMLFAEDENGDIMIAARNNSIIDVTDEAYNGYIAALGVDRES